MEQINKIAWLGFVCLLLSCGAYSQTLLQKTIAENEFPCISYYADNDGDGFGDPQSSVVSCNGAPGGYVNDGTDCDDSDPGIHISILVYEDADNDGYGTGNSLTICAASFTAPIGYALNASDCNDLISALNPSQPEILYNGIDDNCNAVLDEGSQITTQIFPTQCGITLPALGSLIACTSVVNITAYRFHITNLTTGAVETLVRPIPYFTLTMLPSYNYNTTYSIKVELQRFGIWLGYYGPSCQITSPNIFNSSGAQITPGQCGITLPSLGTLIATTSVAGISSYRFRVTNITDPNAPNQIQVLERTIHWFSLLMLHNYNYGTTYLVEVSVKTYGVYSGYGSPCSITAPPVPMLTNCGAVITAPSSMIPTSSLAYVTSYRFEITNLSTGVVTTIDRPLNFFRFSHFPAFNPGAVHAVRVSLMTSGVYSLYGDACEITSPGGTRYEHPRQNNEFSVTAYPNPFTDSFKVDVNSGNETEIFIKIYDATGRTVETRRLNSPAFADIKIGEEYPSGVYNVIVEQSGKYNTLRLIKR